MQTAVRFAVCIALTVFLSGCFGTGEISAPGGRLTDYAASDASYTIEYFPEGAEHPISACCTRSGSVTMMQLTSPDRIAGMTVTYDANAASCALAAGDMSIQLSPETAAGLTGLFDLLARPAEDGGIPSKSPDGSQTVVTFDTGSVTVGETGVPTEVTFAERTVRIGGFTIQ